MYRVLHKKTQRRSGPIQVGVENIYCCITLSKPEFSKKFKFQFSQMLSQSHRAGWQLKSEI